MTVGSDLFLRRQAVALVSTLPEDRIEAKIILRLANELLDGFLSEESSRTYDLDTLACQLRRGVG